MMLVEILRRIVGREFAIATARRDDRGFEREIDEAFENRQRGLERQECALDVFRR
jgi:hypothetical protein